MEFLSVLNSAIQRLDHIEFLTYYCMASEKEKLQLPSAVTLPIMVQFWYDFFQTYQLHVQDSFLEALSKFSLELVKQCNVSNVQVSATTFLSVIKNQSNQQRKKTGKRVVGSKNTVLSEISDSYDTLQKEKNRIPKNLNILKELLLSSIDQENEKMFLLYYLSYSRFEQVLRLPNSTVKVEIFKLWSLIFKQELNTTCSNRFLKRLTHYWFVIVHRFGIPITKKDQYNIYLYLLAQPVKSVKPGSRHTKTTKKGFLNKLFGI